MTHAIGGGNRNRPGGAKRRRSRRDIRPVRPGVIAGGQPKFGGRPPPRFAAAENQFVVIGMTSASQKRERRSLAAREPAEAKRTHRGEVSSEEAAVICGIVGA